MLDHVTVRAADQEASRRFYNVVLPVLGFEPVDADERFCEWGDYSVAQADDGQPVTRHLHVAFDGGSREKVDAFWQAGVDAGYPSDGEPGLRPQYHPDYYGGFLLDPDGNSVEACTGFREPGPGGMIDHLWIGVRDLVPARRFWETVAGVLGLRIGGVRETRFHVAAGNRSFALVADGRPPTENVHLAFPVPGDEVVAEFHRIATAAGYEDNGGPGERPEYHPGYVGAFVLDPDGNNVEAVNHNR
ncbi:MAG TPA: VOC family protein [Gaiellaceae bacterium]|nr:VOC family protein [Gaiellaceae bacterium]